MSQSRNVSLFLTSSILTFHDIWFRSCGVLKINGSHFVILSSRIWNIQAGGSKWDKTDRKNPHFSITYSALSCRNSKLMNYRITEKQFFYSLPLHTEIMDLWCNKYILKCIQWLWLIDLIPCNSTLIIFFGPNFISKLQMYMKNRYSIPNIKTVFYLIQELRRGVNQTKSHFKRRLEIGCYTCPQNHCQKGALVNFSVLPDTRLRHYWFYSSGLEQCLHLLPDTSDQMDHSKWRSLNLKPWRRHRVPPNRMTMMHQLSQQVASVPIQSP